MDTCPYTDKITAYLDGELPPDEAGALETHLADCPQCAAAIDDLRDTVRALSAWSLPDDLPSRAEEIAAAALATTAAPAGRRRSGISTAWFAASVASALLGFLLGAWMLLSGGGQQTGQGAQPLLDDFHPLPLTSGLLDSLEAQEEP